MSGRLLPPALLFLGSLLTGQAIGALTDRPDLILPSLALGVAFLIGWVAITSSRMRRRIPALQPNRMKLRRLWDDTYQLRSGLEAARRDLETPFARSDWDQRISILDARIWTELREILDEEATILRRETRLRFPAVNGRTFRDDRAWARSMAGLLDERLKMLRKELDRYGRD